jgi:hypothetical protein
MRGGKAAPGALLLSGTEKLEEAIVAYRRL